VAIGQHDHERPPRVSAVSARHCSIVEGAGPWGMRTFPYSRWGAQRILGSRTWRSIQASEEAAVFAKVLVGVDGPASGRDALALAERLSDAGGRLTLMHVHPGLLTVSHALTPALEEADRRQLEEMLEELRAGAGVESDAAIVQGPSPGQVLHEQAEARGSELIVLGSSRRGVLGRAILGDDTRAALNGAPCAVAIAPVGYGERGTSFGTLGVGYDASPESDAALAAARELAARHHAKIRALRIVSPPSYWYAGFIPPVLLELDEVVAGVDREMRAIEGVEGRAEYGVPGEDLAAFSRQVDLLVVGSRSYGPVRRLIHGSTSNYLQRHARSPLLILPRSGAAATAGG
jgi:nucleotide-binding universal stress UspA family protein